MEVQVNYLAVVLAMLSSLVVGSIWYAQKVFGNTWAKLAKIDMGKDRGSVFKPIATTIVDVYKRQFRALAVKTEYHRDCTT